MLTIDRLTIKLDCHKLEESQASITIPEVLKVEMELMYDFLAERKSLWLNNNDNNRPKESPKLKCEGNISLLKQPSVEKITFDVELRLTKEFIQSLSLRIAELETTEKNCFLSDDKQTKNEEHQLMVKETKESSYVLSAVLARNYLNQLYTESLAKLILTLEEHSKPHQTTPLLPILNFKNDGYENQSLNPTSTVRRHSEREGKESSRKQKRYLEFTESNRIFGCLSNTSAINYSNPSEFPYKDTHLKTNKQVSKHTSNASRVKLQRISTPPNKYEQILDKNLVQYFYTKDLRDKTKRAQEKTFILSRCLENSQVYNIPNFTGQKPWIDPTVKNYEENKEKKLPRKLLHFINRDQSTFDECENISFMKSLRPKHQFKKYPNNLICKPMGHKSTARPVETPLDNKSILNSRIRVIEDKILGKVTILKEMGIKFTKSHRYVS